MLRCNFLFFFLLLVNSISFSQTADTITYSIVNSAT